MYNTVNYVLENMMHAHFQLSNTKSAAPTSILHWSPLRSLKGSGRDMQSIENKHMA